jgi:fatty acid desaturase
METTGDDRRAFVRTIYEQHWQQVRQVQRERIWLLLVLAVVFVGALIALRGNLTNIDNWPLVFFLMALALLGLFLSIKMQVVIKAHLSAIELILSRYTLTHYLPRFRPGLVRKTVRISRMIPKFFIFCFSFFLWMFLCIVTYNWWWSLLIAAVIYLVSAIVVFFSKFDEPLPFEED